MERRKILLGSGAALATVLAGCSSTETGEEDPDDGTDDSVTDDNGDDDDDGDDGDDGVPGFDDDALESDSDVMTVMDVDRDDDRLYVLTRTETTDPEVLSKELETVARDIADAVTDPDYFKDEIREVEWVLEYDGSHVLGVFVNVEWVIDYLEGELSEEELAKKVRESKEE